MDLQGEVKSSPDALLMLSCLCETTRQYTAHFEPICCIGDLCDNIKLQSRSRYVGNLEVNSNT
jgi:hypothetical protein